MNFLLDTHVWIWSLTEKIKLNPQTLDTLNDSNNHFFLSPISIWETLLLIEKRRLPVNLPGEQWVASALQMSVVESVPLTQNVAIRSRLLQLPHQDPADRFIAATAVEYGLTPMTADEHLLNSTEITTWPVI